MTPPATIMIVFGGGFIPRNNLTTVLSNANGLGGTPAWTQLSPSGDLPPARSYHSVAYDSANNILITYGGFTGSGDNQPFVNVVWALTTATGQGGSPSWSQLSPTGGPPTQRAEHTAVYDPTSDRMIVFGGCTGQNSSSCNSDLNDTWVLTNANGLGGTPQWIQLQPSGPLPSARNQHTAVYDAASNRMIVFGGIASNQGGPVLSDVWVLTNANGASGTPQWIQLAPSGSIPGRFSHTAIYDSVSGSMTVFSGFLNFGFVDTNDVWVLSNANGVIGTPAWTQMKAAGGPPSPRGQGDAVYDPTSNRMTIFGGYTNCSSGCIALSDVWFLTNANGTGSSGLAITEALPNHGGNAGAVTVQIIGNGFVQGDTVSLVSGGTNIPASNVAVAGAGLITGTFPLIGAAAGQYDVVVVEPSGSKATLPAGFTVDQGGAPNIAVQVIGRNLVRFGQATTFYMVVSNSGNVDSDPSLVSVEVPPFLQAAPFSGNSMLTAGVTTKPYFGVPGRNPGSDQFLIFASSGVPAGGTQSAPIQLTLPAGQGSNFTATAGWEFYISNLTLDDTLNQLGFPFVEYDGSCSQCLNAYTAELLAHTALLTPYQSYADAKFKFENQLAKTTSQLVGGIVVFAVVTPILDALGVGTIGGVVIKDLISVLQSCANGYLADPAPQNCLLTQQNLVTLLGNAVQSLLSKGDFPPLARIPLQKLLGALNLIQAALIDFSNLDAASDAVDSAYQSFIQSLTPYEQARVAYITCHSTSCGDDQNPPPPPPPPPGTGTLPVTGVGSLDPNDKVGPAGVGSQGYLAETAPFGYTVLFGNKDNASAPAQQVVITDQLDATKYDLKNFQLGPMGFGSQFSLPSSYQTDFAATIDLRPATNLLVNLNALLDSKTGLATWTFTSIDPATGLPPTDPSIGFLPPGGTGNIMFTVSPKQGLPTNTQIQNRATIIFDANPPMNTPTWLNTIDITPPTSRVSALPGKESCAYVNVGWSGNDIGAGVQNFTVYASDNGAPFAAWLTNTTMASWVFQGQVGHTYGFYSIATDLVGNGEPGKNAAEATTKVTKGNSCGPPSLSGTASVSSYSQGVLSLNLQLSDIGTADALKVMVKQLTFRTLSGSGNVTLASPTLSISVGNIAVDNSSPVALTLNVPATVTKFSITENGTMHDSAGNHYNYSIGQVVVP